MEHPDKDTTQDTIEQLPHEENTEPKKGKRSWQSKLLRWVLGIVGGIVGLLLLLTILLYIPAVQNWVVGTTAKQLRTTIGYDVEIGRIRIGFPVKLNIEGVTARDIESGELVGKLDHLSAQVSLKPLIRGGVIPVSGVEVMGVELDFSMPNDSLSLQGYLNEVAANRIDFDTNTSQLTIDYFRAKDAAVLVTILTDTTRHRQEPPSAPSPLVILINKGELENIAAQVAFDPDTTMIDVRVLSGNLSKGEVNLPNKYYQVEEAQLEAWAGAVGADIDFLPMPWKARLDGSNIRYGGANDVTGDIHSLYYEVGDGWRVEELKGYAVKDSTQLVVKDLDIRLPQTHLYGDARLPFDNWVPAKVGAVDIGLQGRVNLSEVDRFIGYIEGIPQDLYALSLTAKGSMEESVLVDAHLANPQVLTLDLQANARNLLGDPMGSITADYDLQTREKASQTIALLAGGGDPSWRIPANMELRGKANLRDKQLGTDFVLLTPRGHIVGYMQYNTGANAYKGQLQVQELNVQQLLPKDTLGVVTGLVQLEGQGMDLFDERMQAHLFVNLDSIQYGATTFNQIMLLSELKESHLFGAIDAADEALKMTAQLDATLRRNDVMGSLNLFIDTIIPNQIGLNFPIIQAAKLELRSTLRSDLKQQHEFDGELENFWIQTDKNIIRPTNTYVLASTSDSLMYAEVTSGDLSLKVDVENGLNDFTERVGILTDLISESLAQDTIGQLDMAPWLQHYPTMDVQLTMGRNNLLRAYLDEHRIGAQSARLNLRTTTSEGLSGDGVVSYFQIDTFRVDNIDFVLRQDPNFFHAFASAHKERFRNQLPFTIVTSLTTNVQRSEAYLHWTDHREEDFLQMGLELWNRPNGDLTFGFTPDPIVLLHNRFEVVGDDYITLPSGDRTKIQANVELRNPDGASLIVRDEPAEKGHLLRARLEDLRLSRLTGISMIPDLHGIVNADATWLQLADGDGQEYHADVNVADFKFEQKPLGKVHVVADMSDSEADGNYLSADASINENKVAKIISYLPTGAESTERRTWIHADNLPLANANPFLPSRYMVLNGFVSGDVSNYDYNSNIHQATTQNYRGVLQMTDAEVFVPAANETYQLDTKPINIRDGRALFDNYSFTSNDSHLTANGFIQLDQSELPVDITLKGNDIYLLNSTQTEQTEVYGTVNADANLHMQGPISAFQLTGDLSIKGNTNVTYKSRESELRQRNNFKGLVEFTDFSDTLFVARKSEVDSLSLSGLDIRLGIHIDPAARVTALLTSDEQNRVFVQGGGDFNLVIPPYGAMNLSGTYSVMEGDVQLNMPPLSRHFIINPGSRVVWNGLLLKPNIDLSATSRIRSQVSQAGEPSRSVEFDVTLYVEDSLDDLTLRFETEAPSDLTLQNALATLSPEEQNRQSLMLLTTGLYSGSVQSNRGFDMNSALTSIVASQFNSLAGEALDAEINLGIANTSNMYGRGTDYTYSIAKRFYNDRISIIVGGRMMTGQAAAGYQQSFIDNMSLEYRLDEAGTHYLRLFHRRNLDNLLDGEVIETGVGYMIRRRLNHLRDLFNFRRPRSQDITLPREDNQNNEDETTEE